LLQGIFNFVPTILDMNFYSKILLVSTLMMYPFIVKAQDTSGKQVGNPPVFMETFVGNRALAYQMIINKKLQTFPKLGFFSVTNCQPVWKEPKMNDYMVQGNLTYRIIRGIDLSGGFIWNPIDGIRPSAGAILSYGNPQLLAVVNPRIDLTKKANFDVLTLLEYKPEINKVLSLYTRVQGLYTHNLGNDFHSRSYVMLRAGLTYKDISLGVAGNLDWYGPMKINKNNFGGFVAINLF